MVPLAELPARPHQPHFDGTFGCPEEIGNVTDTAVIEVAKVDHRLVFQVQQIECFSKHHQIYFLFEKPLQAKFFPPDAIGRLCFMHEDDLALAPACEVHAMVVGNGKKPCGEFCAGLERPHFMDQFEKDIVHNVFGAGGIPGECDASLVNLDGIALVKLLEVTIVP